MRSLLPIRFWLSTAFVLLLAVSSAYARNPQANHQSIPKGSRPAAGSHASPGYSTAPQRIEIAPVVQQHTAARPEANEALRPAQNQEHLEQWMERHGGLSPDQQQHALENEPGFHDLPPQTQQRYRDRLTQLNNMTPQQRRRRLDQNETLERLTPQQRQQFRDAVQSFSSLSTDRRHMMARAIVSLRELSPDQREKALGSATITSNFSPGERSMLSTLLTGEPYPPTPLQPASTDPNR